PTAVDIAFVLEQRLVAKDDVLRSSCMRAHLSILLPPPRSNLTLKMALSDQFTKSSASSARHPQGLNPFPVRKEASFTLSWRRRVDRVLRRPAHRMPSEV